MKIVVTGGAGFIGRHTVDRLLEQQHEVIVIDWLDEGRKTYEDRRVRFYPAELGSEKIGVIIAKEKPECVIHLAAQVSVQTAQQDPLLDATHNIMNTIHLLKQCVDNHVRKIIFSSSAAVYGNPQRLPIDEQHPVDPLSFYGVSKLVSEMYIQSFAAQYELDYTILRYANVYGPGQTIKGEGAVVASFVSRLGAGERPVIFGDGLNTRDFIYVKDVAAANVAALTSGSGQTMNISTRQPLTIQDLHRMVSEICNSSLTPTYQKSKEGDIQHSLLDASLAKSSLKWSPMYSIYEGLKETVDVSIAQDPVAVLGVGLNG
ncbi:UDP-glucose 4-epimerase [Paenibacillus shirakamiensis]|uniref:UDP-glucose 4-epimerase n=1 Tax=Paenibacillus shirakamiensis TaxID=1265935 RepID=A0ABS4JJR0_9BACL|nr:NAD-dependent epimerase/dehydratase family protein [Paenibacillus shirakamiensis]MBP2001942.1 UDP-glucose 4-epimerase [Paenibacillus shirakamiensis]